MYSTFNSYQLVSVSCGRGVLVSRWGFEIPSQPKPSRSSPRVRAEPSPDRRRPAAGPPGARGPERRLCVLQLGPATAGGQPRKASPGRTAASVRMARRRVSMASFYLWRSRPCARFRTGRHRQATEPRGLSLREPHWPCPWTLIATGLRSLCCFLFFRNWVSDFFKLPLLCTVQIDKVHILTCPINCLSPPPTGEDYQGKQRLETHTASRWPSAGPRSVAGTAGHAFSHAGRLSHFCFAFIEFFTNACSSYLEFKRSLKTTGFRLPLETVSPEKLLCECV